MKSILFALLIIGSATYLVVNDSSALSQWFSNQLPAGQMAKITDSLDKNVSQQLAAFKSQIQAKQQQQIESLQSSLLTMAQKMAKMEQTIKAQQQQLAATPTEATTEFEQHRSQAEPEVVQYVAQSEDSGVEVSTLSAQNESARDEFEQGEPEQSEQSDTAQDNTAQIAANGLMSKQQRRKRLQQLSEDMTLKSLGVE